MDSGSHGDPGMSKFQSGIITRIYTKEQSTLANPPTDLTTVHRYSINSINNIITASYPVVVEMCDYIITECWVFVV